MFFIPQTNSKIVFERLEEKLALKFTHLRRCCTNLKSSCTAVHSGFSFACALHLGNFSSKHGKAVRHKIGRAVLGACLAFCLVLAGEAFSQDLGVVNAFKLNVRSAPARGAGVVFVLDKGDEVEILKQENGEGGWLQIRYKGKKGYVRHRSRYISLTRIAGDTLSKKPKTMKNEGLGTSAARARQAALARQIEKETRKMASFSQRETQILDGLNEIEYALNRARVRAGDLERETRVLARKIEAINQDIGVLKASMSETQAYAGVRLNALYRMHMMGRLEMAGPPSSIFDFVVKQNALKKVVSSDFSLLDRQARDLGELTRLETDLDTRMGAKRELEEELALQIRIQEKESGKKEVILREIRRKKALSKAALASLKDAAQALEAALSSMGLSGSAALDDTSFIRQKGRLAQPVKGRVISRYGTARKGAYNSFTFQSGIDIKVERGEPVRSVFKGEVMFARWFKGYGNLVIINHGDNYYTLYAHVEEIFKKKGERVSTGEVIATAGDTGSIKGLCLHFEVRHHGKPVNPMNWLKKGA